MNTRLQKKGQIILVVMMAVLLALVLQGCKSKKNPAETETAANGTVAGQPVESEKVTAPTDTKSETKPVSQPGDVQTTPGPADTAAPGSDAVTVPGSDAVGDPTTDPTTNPSVTPDTDPATNPTVTPDTDPATAPVTVPVTTPATEPDDDNESKPLLEVHLKPSAASAKVGVTVNSNGITDIRHGNYFGFANVDLTGMRSISVVTDILLKSGSNGETLAILLDDAVKGDCIGYVSLGAVNGQNQEIQASIEPTDGKHTVYFRAVHGNADNTEIIIKELTFSNQKYQKEIQYVPDSAIRDSWSDTWVAVDDYGRAIADYSEVGRVDDGSREVVMLYWNWFGIRNDRATVISDVLERYPEAKDDYAHPGWDPMMKAYWAEPLLGYYNATDYWVYRKHAEMLANAGVDAILFDWTNGGMIYIQSLKILAQAFRDAKAAGVDVPRIGPFAGTRANEEAYRGLASVYMQCFVTEDYSDIWYYKDGKPFMWGWSPDHAASAVSGNQYESFLVRDIKQFFTYRYSGVRNNEADGAVGAKKWQWLECFPQVLRNPDESGRPEVVSVGVAVNQSTVYGASIGGVFSDEFSKGRDYSEAFGEDFTDAGMREAYFFREQAQLALKADPKTVLICGWNEWTATRQSEYNGYKNSFVDSFDDEHSRDFEPTTGVLKDDCYNMLVDFIRKYKGVRPNPTASGTTTIDINGSVDQWSDVGPEFLNVDQNYERDSYGFCKSLDLVNDDTTVFEKWHYTTTVNNAISSAKVSFDKDNFYFLVNTAEDVVTGTQNWMHLFINIDRNKATGWEGYDYAINVGGAGKISKYENDAWVEIGTAAYKVSGNALQMSVARSLFGETGTVDFEFKWTDSVAADNLLDFYRDGSSAPLGRFNYLYTEIEQTAITGDTREALQGTTVIGAGNNNMVVNGGKMKVYEADIRITPYEANDTLYVPLTTFVEIMGYGTTKTFYDEEFNMFRTANFDMNESLRGMTNYNWTYGELGSTTVRINNEKTIELSAAPIMKDGMIYVPISFIAECYGRTVTDLGNGLYSISTGTPHIAAVNEAVKFITE